MPQETAVSVLEERRTGMASLISHTIQSRTKAGGGWGGGGGG